MSSQTVTDYLTKQIFIERNIVTYQLLSRDLRIHVNAAKNELATYHAIAPYQGQTCFATYAICGEVFADQARQSQGDTEDFDMEAAVDDDLDYEYDEGEDVPQTTIMLVNERDFENARSKFTRIDSIHVYSLAPAHIHDAGLLCTPTESVRMIDGKAGSEIASIVGKIVGANIQLKPTEAGKISAAGPSRRRPPADAASTSKPTVQAPIEKSSSKADITKEKSKIVADKPKEKLRPTGKLNFAKAKVKETKDEPKAEQDLKESSKTASTSDPKLKESRSKEEPRKDEKPSKEEIKRGTKRKSLKALMSESEDDKSSISQSKQPSESHSKGNVRVNKRTVLSDDDDDYSSPRPRMSRMSLGNAVDSESERDLKALMDIDDDEVIRVTRKEPVLMKEEEEESSEDAQMDDITPKPKPKKRREKKSVPVGRNGLKKKRVVKSRMTTDAKGYMVTEDYSSYESVDEEEEPEPAAPAKGKAKAKSSSKVKKEEDSSTPPAPTVKPAKRASFGPDAQSAGAKATKSRPGPSKNGAQKQKPLMNFFAPKAKS